MRKKSCLKDFKIDDLVNIDKNWKKTKHFCCSQNDTIHAYKSLLNTSLLNTLWSISKGEFGCSKLKSIDEKEDTSCK